jgi:hypothetical protein
MCDMTKHGVARTVSSILGVYGGFLGFEHGIGEILQGNLAVPTIRINAYGSAGLPFPFGHEPAMTLLPTFLLTGIAATLTAMLIMFWSAFFTSKKPAPLVLLLLSILLLFVGGGYGPIPILIFAVIAGFEARSQFGIWRKLPLIFRRFLALSWKWFVALIFIVVIASIPWGYVSGMNDPSFSRETYTSLAMASGLLQVFFALLAVIAAAANDSLNAHAA